MTGSPRRCSVSGPAPWPTTSSCKSPKAWTDVTKAATIFPCHEQETQKLTPGVATLAAPVSQAVVVPVRDRTLRFNERWNYSPAPEIHTDLKIRPRYDLFIGGKFVQPSSGKYFPSINPATEKQHAEIALGSAADVDKAVKAARRAYERRGARCPDASAPSISSALPASCRKNPRPGRDRIP